MLGFCKTYWKVPLKVTASLQLKSVAKLENNDPVLITGIYTKDQKLTHIHGYIELLQGVKKREAIFSASTFFLSSSLKS